MQEAPGPHGQPSEQPSTQLRGNPAEQPSGQLSEQPSKLSEPAEQPKPSGQPSEQLSDQPSSQPCEQPSSQSGPISRRAVLAHLLESPSRTAWLEVIFAMEGLPLDPYLAPFGNAARSSLAALGGLQQVLNARITADVSDSCQVIPFVQAGLAKKKKVNCLGSALAALLVADANSIPCTVYCSENHSWLETEGGVKVDVSENLKAAKKSALPLSIYANARELDDFSLCMLVIVNKNGLSDADEFFLLHKFQHKLRFSWEFSKLYSLANELDALHSVPRDLLHRDPASLGLAADRALRSISEEGDARAALADMDVLLDKVTRLCSQYNVDSDWWLHPRGSFLNICEEFTSEFRGQLDVERLYEEWVDRVTALALASVPKAWGKFSKSAPLISGKRRRIEKNDKNSI
jgi:hypothetical protein